MKVLPFFVLFFFLVEILHKCIFINVLNLLAVIVVTILLALTDKK